eukprot:TRINITY_DN1916_c0_g1_i1.p1 TRINITY_DN1916_c0_g1~~TRINITY_DN1916_c0_g1_i1.p1  ORF type:complete len:543 (+),score=130.32 TRINITY_DN1916_c0_g1_i1:34-1629(+)
MGRSCHESDSENSSSSEAESSSSGSESESGERAGFCARCFPWCNGYRSSREIDEQALSGPKERGFTIENTGKNINDYFDLDQKMPLGEGGFATVRKARCKLTGNARAVKCVSRKMSSGDQYRLDMEIRTTQSMDHPNIVRMYEAFQDSRTIYLVMELCQGGDLYDAIISQVSMSEADTGILMEQIFRGCVYMHEAGVCHRDLKPENFLLWKNGPIKGNVLKIIDFGIAAHFNAARPETAEMKSKRGTPYYVAPEVMSRPSYNEKCDLWSAGVILYILLCGMTPWGKVKDDEVMKKVIKGKFNFNPAPFRSVSQAAKDLICRLLEMDTRKRYSAKQALSDPWVRETAARQTSPLSMEVVQNLRNFSKGNQLKKAALHVLARHQDENVLERLREYFLELDEDGDGTITFKELHAGLVRSGIRNLNIQELERICADMDSDNSGQIDYTEFLTAAMGAREWKDVIQEREYWAAFRVFDKNDDGKISPDELLEMLKVQKADGNIAQEQMQSIMREVDTNGDGEIDFEEFVVMMRRQ